MIETDPAGSTPSSITLLRRETKNILDGGTPLQLDAAPHSATLAPARICP
ncbi:hypothetical protein HMPREF9056_00009 [Actinomyces sp. oral taxon 170 str. F0386]|nr:hypothetical protein HMPREF9056_00009 [Actinomyces sp. oral taxon 170 str. F0386]